MSAAVAEGLGLNLGRVESYKLVKNEGIHSLFYLAA